MTIPRKVHQIFGLFPGDNIENHPRFVECLEENRKFCKEHGYEHKLWGKDEIDQFISSKFHYYHQLWEDFSQPVQRADFARYCILFIYGGLYIDLDIKIIQDPTPLLDNPYFFSTWNNDKRMLPYNAVLGCEDNLKLYQDILQHCRESFYEKIKMEIYKKWKGRLVFQTSGHFMLQRVLKRHGITPMDLLKINTKKGVVVSGPNPYFEDYNLSTWFKG